jgi:hypothetical protein
MLLSFYKLKELEKRPVEEVAVEIWIGKATSRVY